MDNDNYSDDFATAVAQAKTAAVPTQAPNIPSSPTQDDEPADFSQALSAAKQQAAQDKYKSETTRADQLDHVPSWSEIPGLARQNIGASASDLAQNTIQPFVHPINTLRDLGMVGLGLIQKTGILPKENWEGNYEQYPEAVGNMLMKRYGSIDNFKKTLATDPLGLAADLSSVLSGGGSMAARAPGLIGKMGEATRTIGNLTDPLQAVTRPVQAAGKIAAPAAKEILGLRTGAGPEAISEAYQAGKTGGDPAQALTENMRQQVPLEGVVDQAITSLHNMTNEKNATYKADIAAAGLNVPMKAADYRKIGDAVMEANKIGTQVGWQYSRDAQRANSEVQKIIADFLSQPAAQSHTIYGMDALKKAIGEYKSNIGDNAIMHKVADVYYNGIRQAVVDRSPKYAAAMDAYQEFNDTIQQIRKSFSLPANQRKVVIDTALRKLQSVMRNNASTNYGFRSTLMQGLEQNGAPNLRTALAGQALSSVAPRGLARLSFEVGTEAATGLLALFQQHDPRLLAGALGAAAVSGATSSPRLMGEAAYLTGKGARMAPPALRAAQQVGRWDPNENNQRLYVSPARQHHGGAVDRALRAAKRHH